MNVTTPRGSEWIEAQIVDIVGNERRTVLVEMPGTTRGAAQAGEARR